MVVACVATATPVHSEPSPEIPMPPVTPAEAPTPRGTLDLETAIKLALEHNPSLAAAAWHARSAALNTRSESKVPNPSLDLTEENFGWDLGGSHRETTISAFQMLELGGDRSSRRKIALGQEQVAAAEWTSRQRDVIAETSSAFLDAWWLESRLDLLHRAEGVAEATIAGAKERTRIGAAPPVEGRRAEAVLAERMVERRALEADAAAARRTLALQWGATRAEFDSLELPPTTLPDLPPADTLVAYLRSHPERLQAVAQTSVEAARVLGAHATHMPDLTLSFGARRFEDARGNGFVAGASFPIPIWNGHSELIQSAQAEQTSAASRQRAVERQLEQELRAAYDSLTAARDKEEIVRTRLLPAAREALTELQRGYRLGRFTYLDQLDGQRAALDAEMMELQLIQDLWSARFTLERLLGRRLEEIAGASR
jgi:cobalt-zinc-cadmium efflux system outer membrane protein